jgi:hypothetical protein
VTTGTLSEAEHILQRALGFFGATGTLAARTVTDVERWATQLRESSTKNAAHARDPEMRQTKKGNTGTSG